MKGSCTAHLGPRPPNGNTTRLLRIPHARNPVAARMSVPHRTSLMIGSHIAVLHGHVRCETRDANRRCVVRVPSCLGRWANADHVSDGPVCCDSIHTNYNVKVQRYSRARRFYGSSLPRCQRFSARSRSAETGDFTVFGRTCRSSGTVYI